MDGVVLMRNYFNLESTYCISPPNIIVQQKFLESSVDFGLGKVPHVGSFFTGRVDTRDGFENVYFDTEDSDESSNEPTKLNMVSKARITIPIEHYWKEGTEYCLQALKTARNNCGSIPDMKPGINVIRI